MTDEPDTTDDGPGVQPDDNDEPPANRPLDRVADEGEQPSSSVEDGDESVADGDENGATLTDADADVRGYLLKGALVMLVVLGVVATLQFYLSAQTAIRRLASDEFRPVFVAAFNLVVLLVVGVGIAQVVRRMG